MSDFGLEDSNYFDNSCDIGDFDRDIVILGFSVIITLALESLVILMILIILVILIIVPVIVMILLILLILELLVIGFWWFWGVIAFV